VSDKDNYRIDMIKINKIESIVPMLKDCMNKAFKGRINEIKSLFKNGMYRLDLTRSLFDSSGLRRYLDIE